MPPKTSKRDAARAALPLAAEAAAFLTEHGRQPLADAVTTLADYARSSGFDDRPVTGKTVALYGSKDLIDRARAQSGGLSAAVIDGYRAFLAGTWEPQRPSGAFASAGEKGTTSIRVPDDLLAQVETAGREFATSREWDMRRGYALNARHIALQWLDHKYPAPKTARTTK